MRIAIVGSGISGLLCARLLHEEHEVTLFEANDYVGGHTNTVRVKRGDRCYDIDTGFIVYNERSYPNFIRLLSLLGVETQPTTMSFSVRCERSGFEYGTASWRALLAQPSNLFRREFHRMFRDLLRFHREAPALLREAPTSMSGRAALPRDAWDRPEDAVVGLTLGEYLRLGDYSAAFVDRYIVPMGAAIWSTEPSRFLEFPASSFVRFFDNHGLLSLSEHPRWRVIRGGSARYVERLSAPLRDRIRLNSPVRSVRRTKDAVEVHTPERAPECFDHIVLATHSDQALRLLTDPGNAEREILGAIGYQPNEAILHSDESVLPRKRQAWSAWNYRIPQQSGPVVLSYNMNVLQDLDSEETFCVTLNDRNSIDPARVLRRISYEHPLFTPAAVAAQRRRAEISGVNRTHYAGAYWGYGFHEDGVNSALAVTRSFGLDLDCLLPQLDRRRASNAAAEGQRLAS